MALGLAAYRALTDAAGPALQWYLGRRVGRGREDPERLGERLGAASAPRPPGALVWLHAASVGESLSLLPVVEALGSRRPGLARLLTTGTVSSARLLAERLPPGVVHQYAPVDRRAWVRRFLDHWRPDLALFAESELWPNLLAETQARGVPTGLLNARISEASYRNWRRLPGLIRPLLGGLALCLAQSEAQARRLGDLGAPAPRAVGNLKCAARPPAADEAELRALRARLAGRPLWLAASTHAGEEAAAAEAHAALAAAHPGLLTVIAPRHPARGDAVAALLARRGLAAARRSRGEAPGPETEVYLADTMGELGLFYRLAEVAFVGGSLARRGGHNPVEPARLGCAIVHGPDMGNFAEVAAALARAGASEHVADAAGLAAAVGRLLAEPEARGQRIDAARQVAEAEAGVLPAVMAELAPLIDRLEGGEARAAAGL